VAATSVVVIAVDPALPGMSRLADRLEGAPVLPRRRALVAALEEAAEKKHERGGVPIVAILPSPHPALVAIAVASGAERIALYHTADAPIPPWKEAPLRAAFSVVDRTIVSDEAAEKSAIKLGADPDRIARAEDRSLARMLAEPRRRSALDGAAEAAASLALDLAEATGLIRLAELLSPTKGVNVVNYHRVLPVEELKSYGRPQMAIAAPLFEVQLEQIAQRGFAPVDRVRDPKASGQVAITFDDGYEDNFRVALPILQRFSAPACVFLVTSLIGRPEALWWDRVGLSLFAFWRSGADRPIPEGLPRRARALLGCASFEEARQIISDVLGELNDVDEETREQALAAAESLLPGARSPRTMLSWDEVEQMRREGVAFGSHTKNHVCLDQVPPDVARDELLGSAADLERRLGPNGGRVVALPRGKLGPFQEHELRELGFDAVMTTEPGVNRPGDDSVFVRRRDGKYLTLRGRHHPAKLRLELSGLFDLLRRGPTW
jgi:peptidoglycan/xylan/chitin deacetylase (PgdA/CDA1 family)